MLAVIVALAGVRALAQQQSPSTNLKVDYLFLIDVSGSMDGHGSGHPTVIFPKVKNAISGFLRTVEPGTTVYFAPFAEKIREIRPFVLNGPADYAAATGYLDGLKADGLSTAVYNSIDEALNYASSKRTTDAQRAANPIIVHIYTDGTDTVRHLTLEQILQHFELRKGPHDWMFYTELGLPHDPKKEAAFAGQDNTVYVAEQAGQVRPITVIEARLPFMNFGNVMETQSPERDQQFVVRGTQPLPVGFSLSVEPVFDGLRSAGVLADIVPAKVPVTGQRTKLKLTLGNIEGLTHGVYRGKMQIKPSDPLVIVVPDEIAAVFSYQPPKRFVVSAAPGERLPATLGEILPGHSAAFHLRVTPNDEARTTPVTFRLADSSSNAARLGLGNAVYVDRQRGRTEGTLPTGEIVVVLQPPQTLPAGDYRGTLDLSAADGQFVEGTTVVGNSVSIPWSFRIPPPPTPWWVWAMVIAAVLLAVGLGIYMKTRPPRLPDLQLQMLKPRVGSLDLTGLKRQSFGPSSNQLTDISSDFAIVAQKKDGSVAAMLETEAANIRLLRRKEKIDVIQQEELHPGDVIAVDEYEMRVESTALNEA